MVGWKDEVQEGKGKLQRAGKHNTGLKIKTKVSVLVLSGNEPAP